MSRAKLLERLKHAKSLPQYFNDLTRIHAVKSRFQTFWIGFQHRFAESKSQFRFAFCHLLKNRFDEATDRRLTVMQAFTAEVGIQSRWYHFNDFDVFCFYQMPQRKREGMKKCFCGRINRRFCKWWAGRCACHSCENHNKRNA